MQVDTAPPLALLLLLVLLDHKGLVRHQRLGMGVRSQRSKYLPNHFLTLTTSDLQSEVFNWEILGLFCISR